MTTLQGNGTFNEQSTTLQLVDGQEGQEKYATLSHRWGELPIESQTTEDNLSRRSSISFEELTPTFRDAVEIAVRLDINYIWIDAVCIVQDSKEDWARESVKMGFIYQNSTLAIAASKGDNSLSGCFNEKSFPADNVQRLEPPASHPSFVRIYEGKESSPIDRVTIDITNPTSTGESSTLIFSHLPMRHDPIPLKSSPLSSRGWILQERALSPRTIHFTADQLVWECRMHHLLEDGSPAGTRETKSSLTGDVIGSGDRLELNETMRWWYRVVVEREYAKRQFTKFGVPPRARGDGYRLPVNRHWRVCRGPVGGRARVRPVLGA
jgi:hypothetical protein